MAIWLDSQWVFQLEGGGFIRTTISIRDRGLPPQPGKGVDANQLAGRRAEQQQNNRTTEGGFHLQASWSLHTAQGRGTGHPLGRPHPPNFGLVVLMERYLASAGWARRLPTTLASSSVGYVEGGPALGGDTTKSYKVFGIPVQPLVGRVGGVHGTRRGRRQTLQVAGTHQTTQERVGTGTHTCVPSGTHKLSEAPQPPWRADMSPKRPSCVWAGIAPSHRTRAKNTTALLQLRDLILHQVGEVCRPCEAAGRRPKPKRGEGVGAGGRDEKGAGWKWKGFS